MSLNSYKGIDHPMKMCQRIWSGFTKYIRQQCKKDKVVDSLLFGVYAKKETTTQDDTETHQYKLFADGGSSFPGYSCTS